MQGQLHSLLYINLNHSLKKLCLFSITQLIDPSKSCSRFSSACFFKVALETCLPVAVSFCLYLGVSWIPDCCPFRCVTVLQYRKSACTADSPMSVHAHQPNCWTVSHAQWYQHTGPLLDPEWSIHWGRKSTEGDVFEILDVSVSPRFHLTGFPIARDNYAYECMYKSCSSRFWAF